MTAILALLGPFLPYLIGGVSALVVGGGYVLKVKRDAKNSGIAEQQAREAQANAKDLDVIQRATGAAPVGGVPSDPNNRDNARG